MSSKTAAEIHGTEYGFFFGGCRCSLCSKWFDTFHSQRLKDSGHWDYVADVGGIRYPYLCSKWFDTINVQAVARMETMEVLKEATT